MTEVEPEAWLVTHPPARSQYRHPRRAEPSGVIAMHTAENTPDTVAFDGGAEAVANFIRNRDTPGSYCDLVDSDSCMHLVRYMDEAFHDGTGTNPHSYGLSIATRADVWPLAPQAWRDGAIEQAAQAAGRYARWLHDRSGIVIPPGRITADQARARTPGFVTHAALDPTRRSDPGRDFPWDQFLARYTEIMEDDDMPTAEEIAEAMRPVIREEVDASLVSRGLVATTPDKKGGAIGELRRNERRALQELGVPADEIED